MLDIDEVQTEELSVFQLMQPIPDDIAAGKWFENIRWPEGKVCPKCTIETATIKVSRLSILLFCKERYCDGRVRW